MTFAEQFPFINLPDRIEEERRAFESENTPIKAPELNKIGDF